MKKRFRSLVRGGWHVHELPPTDNTVLDMNDESHYRGLRDWCAKNVSKDEWEGTMLRNTRPQGKKRFVFKNIEDKLLFALRWS